MRFATRYDPWLDVLLVVTGLLVGGGLPFLRFYAPGDHPAPVWLVILPWFIWGVALAATLPQYYEVRPDGLFIRQGWHRFLIAYASVTELQSVSSAMSAPVLSTQRLLIVTNEGRRILIAVADEARFLDEVAHRASQLERRPYGLGLPLAPPTFV